MIHGTGLALQARLVYNIFYFSESQFVSKLNGDERTCVNFLLLS